MGVFKRIKKAAKTGQRDVREAEEMVHERQLQKKMKKRADLKAQGIVMELKSLEGKVILYDDRVVVQNLIGSEAHDIPYTQITSVYVDKINDLAKDAGAAVEVGSTLAMAGKNTLVIDAGGRNFQMDFRKEPVEKIHTARDFIAQRISGKMAAAISQSVKTMQQGKPAVDPADEILKLADLRDKGLITDEEFQAEKKKLLGL